jgi:hypothetical protein
MAELLSCGFVDFRKHLAFSRRKHLNPPQLPERERIERNPQHPPPLVAAQFEDPRLENRIDDQVRPLDRNAAFTAADVRSEAEKP